jgi:hypothetical protein
MNAIHTAVALFAKRRAGTRGSSGRPGNLRFRNAALLEPQEPEPALDQMVDFCLAALTPAAAAARHAP